MCRFLLAKSSKDFETRKILSKFSQMAKNSKAHDGDSQGDGWGVSWWNGRRWEQYVSLKPVWKDKEFFSHIPNTRLLVVHARSASFEKDKETIAFNQPFIKGRYIFVFNGLLKGVSVPFPLQGRIGSQKIWSLIQKQLENTFPAKAIVKSVEILNSYTRVVQALNIGLSDGKKIYCYTQYSIHEEYYNLRQATTRNGTIIVSEPIKKYRFVKIPTGKVVSY